MFGLPPPRSAAYEKMKEEQANKFPTARVRVFMPQSYNCPVGLYSPQNVMHTFQDQAEQVIGALERYGIVGAQYVDLNGEVTVLARSYILFLRYTFYSKCW